ncbi:MAG: addiction module antitoxin [Chloroflexi bacterium RBG_19FT_COMBO_55_16]|nr:MAG: addiction module antitoxin [Chloroflexi bacterium RBG_19FT_COMBO_55_16]
MYQVRLLDAATQELENLDKPIVRRIITRMYWLAENLENIKRLKLKGDLSAFYKLRVGDYRIFYQVLEEEQVIIVHKIGHRSEIYR